jgi:NADPH-dependent curcumin reductase CurA
MAVQIAKKLVGCKRVIGIAGGPEKCKWVESLGADKCLDYKSKTFLEDLKAATPDYADVYYDNVGGDILNAVLPRIKRWGKIIACGMISSE